MCSNFDWNFILNDQINSGLSIRQYCIQNNICQATFYNHKKLAKHQSDISPAFQPVEIVHDDISLTINGIHISCHKNDLHFILEAFK